MTLRASEQLSRFEQTILPHDEAAYNLARWLTGNDQDARDVVQEAYLRAYQFFGSFRGGDGRAWWLAIVRNTGYTWLERNRSGQPAMAFDERKHSGATSAARPEAPLVQHEDVEMLRRAINALAPEYREAIVLRELEGLSYREIAGVTGVPMGTVMSRLARAREQLHQRLADRTEEGP
jgi:RNA polymerase sigma-70 factor (ECF subfamily)